MPTSNIPSEYIRKKWKRLDAIPRKDHPGWYDEIDYSEFDLGEAAPYSTNVESFERVVCPECNGSQFEILKTAIYETTAHCPCGAYFVVHSG